MGILPHSRLQWFFRDKCLWKRISFHIDPTYISCLKKNYTCNRHDQSQVVTKHIETILLVLKSFIILRRSLSRPGNCCNNSARRSAGCWQRSSSRSSLAVGEFGRNSGRSSERSPDQRLLASYSKHWLVVTHKVNVLVELL